LGKNVSQKTAGEIFWLTQCRGCRSTIQVVLDVEESPSSSSCREQSRPDCRRDAEPWYNVSVTCS